MLVHRLPVKSLTHLELTSVANLSEFNPTSFDVVHLTCIQEHIHKHLWVCHPGPTVYKCRENSANISAYCACMDGRAHTVQLFAWPCLTMREHVQLLHQKNMRHGDSAAKS